MSDTKTHTVEKKASVKISHKRYAVPPLSDPRITVAPKIIEKLRSGLTKQSGSVAVLVKTQLDIKSQEAIGQLIQGMQELGDLMVEVEEAIEYAVNSGWEFGAKRGVSNQNSKNATSQHERSNRAKTLLIKLWQSKEWKTKTACVDNNFERIMREVGLWEQKKEEQKPSARSLIRWLQSQKSVSVAG
jgi:hypothetical protein